MTPPEEHRTELERRAERVLAKVYGGVHNCVGWPRRKIGQGILELSVPDGISTYDCARLTKLVIAAHDECMRVEMLASGPRRLKLYMTLRKRDTDSFATRHPTIEQAIATVRGVPTTVDFVYLGRAQCGCVLQSVVDVPDEKYGTADTVAEMIREGLTIERVHADDERNRVDRCEHGAPSNELTAAPKPAEKLPGAIIPLHTFVRVSGDHNGPWLIRCLDCDDDAQLRNPLVEPKEGASRV